MGASGGLTGCRKGRGNGRQRPTWRGLAGVQKQHLKCSRYLAECRCVAESIEGVTFADFLGRPVRCRCDGFHGFSPGSRSKVLIKPEATEIPSFTDRYVKIGRPCSKCCQGGGIVKWRGISSFGHHKSAAIFCASRYCNLEHQEWKVSVRRDDVEPTEQGGRGPIRAYHASATEKRSKKSSVEPDRRQPKASSVISSSQVTRTASTVCFSNTCAKSPASQWRRGPGPTRIGALSACCLVRHTFSSVVAKSRGSSTTQVVTIWSNQRNTACNERGSEGRSSSAARRMCRISGMYCASLLDSVELFSAS
eukprot:scaffold272518_cov30-Tisochrysis_lutea.AAC.5